MTELYRPTDRALYRARIDGTTAGELRWHQVITLIDLARQALPVLTAKAICPYTPLPGKCIAKADKRLVSANRIGLAGELQLPAGMGAVFNAPGGVRCLAKSTNAYPLTLILTSDTDPCPLP